MVPRTPSLGKFCNTPENFPFFSQNGKFWKLSYDQHVTDVLTGRNRVTMDMNYTTLPKV